MCLSLSDFPVCVVNTFFFKRSIMSIFKCEPHSKPPRRISIWFCGPQWKCVRVCVHSARGWGFFSFFFLSMHMHECMFISKCADDRPFTHKSESLKILQMVMTLNATIQQFKTIIKKKKLSTVWCKVQLYNIHLNCRINLSPWKGHRLLIKQLLTHIALCFTTK